MVSHELRSQLNAITGWAHLLRTGGLEADRVQRAVETITRNAALQSQLISDILDIQSLTSGKLRLQVQDVDLALTIEAVLDSIKPAAVAKNISLTPRLDAAYSTIQGDPDRMQQVIWNLLSNAVKFTPEGGRVEVLLRGAGSGLEITVQDTGPGVRAEFIPYMFDRFRQDAPVGGRPGGLGLGLAIVRQLVELHGGSVSVENRDAGSGAVFTVRFPRSAKPQVGAVTASAVAASSDLDFTSALPPSLRELRVLVVDDEPESREVVAAVLGQYGADVTLAGSADEAVVLFGRIRPHILVSDISMPDRDGYSLLREIRALSKSEGGLTPAVALTAGAANEDRLNALRAGYQFHLPKPVQPAELASAIVSLTSAFRSS
jgi:CheY-like chemotaxis protein/DNA-directed RNA polymerase subunit F